MEHHANFVPWQQLQKRKKIKLDVVSLNADQTLDLKELDKKLALKPKLLCITHISNAIGTINPIEQIIKKAHAVGTKVLVDGSQSAPHMAIDLKKLNPDFFVCTGHKMLGPFGIGVLMMKKEIADNIPPFLTGGDMISQVTLKETHFLESPQKFEAGTPNIVAAIGLATCTEYLKKIGMEEIRNHEKNLFNTAWKALSKQKDIQLFGPENTDEHAGIISFTMKGAHPHDIAQIFDTNNIAIRAGNHCCQPLINSLGIPATARISFYLYNDENDIQKVLDALDKVRKVFK
jgi:cysteine desulfurase/selenocysteine lyase